MDVRTTINRTRKKKEQMTKRTVNIRLNSYHVDVCSDDNMKMMLLMLLLFLTCVLVMSESFNDFWKGSVFDLISFFFKNDVVGIVELIEGIVFHKLQVESNWLLDNIFDRGTSQRFRFWRSLFICESENDKKRMITFNEETQTNKKQTN
jgi:hypothetical protein